MALQIDDWPLKGIRVRGTLVRSDVEPLIDALLRYRQGGAVSVSIHLEVTSADAEAAADLHRRLLEVTGGTDKIFLHVVRGPVADVLLEAGFSEDESGPCPLVYMDDAS